MLCSASAHCSGVHAAIPATPYFRRYVCPSLCLYYLYDQLVFLFFIQYTTLLLFAGRILNDTICFGRRPRGLTAKDKHSRALPWEEDVLGTTRRPLRLDFRKKNILCKGSGRWAGRSRVEERPSAPRRDEITMVTRHSASLLLIICQKLIQSMQHCTCKSRAGCIARLTHADHDERP